MAIEGKNIQNGHEDDSAAQQGEAIIPDQLAYGPGAVDLVAGQCGRDEDDGAVLCGATNADRDMHRHAAVAFAHVEHHVV